MTILSLIIGKKFFPVRFKGSLRRDFKGCFRVDREVTVIMVLIFKIIFRLNFWIAVG